MDLGALGRRWAVEGWPGACASTVPGSLVGVSLGRLLSSLRDEPALVEIGSHGGVVAVPDAARAYVLAGIVKRSKHAPVVVATPTGNDAERLAHDLGAYLGREMVELFPAWETLPFERVSPAVETMGARLKALWRLQEALAGNSSTTVIVAPIRALLQLLAPGVLDRRPIVVAKGQMADPDELVERLVAEGYRREYQVEHRGEVSRRGSIVDVYPSTGELPVRIDFWGDDVDRLMVFDMGDQRSLGEIDSVEIFGCRELVPTGGVTAKAERLINAQPWGRPQWERLAEGMFFDGMESWLPWMVEGDDVVADLLGEGARVVLIDPRRMADRAGELKAEEASLAQTLGQTWGADDEGVELACLHVDYDRLLLKSRADVLSVVPTSTGPATPAVEASGWSSVISDPGELAARLGALVRDGYRVVVCAEGDGSAKRLSSVLGGAGLDAPVRDAATIPPSAGVWVVTESLERGFVAPAARVAILAEADLTGRRRAHRKARPRARAVEGFFDSLTVGDFVVHHIHGVGRYLGMVKRAIGGAERDYLLLEYKGGDRLYVPSEQIDTVTPYTGGESPALHRLGGSDFARAKAKVRDEVSKVAEELVELYRQRMEAPGKAFSPDTPWQAEMEAAFPWSETADQLKAISDVKADMERDHPMDRLLCGDVGFGKTEVAIRAAFKAIQDGAQVAVLVPTTLLAQQHFQTFSERFAGYPMRVEVLSRFLTPSQARSVLSGLADGSVDLVIGTHRLLSVDAQFKRLGLLIVDEEQRFGVSHKEAIKAMTVGVDVLTLTATPIPRTLEMSLTGIRDLTLLETPPAARQPILTYVGEYDERAVAEAIRRELLREGQVFFVHNRIADIAQVADRIARLVPEARVAFAHGQMDEGSLESVVLDFWQGNYDVLVCTTIIESGIDMPSVNTLVVDRADTLGLGQLHQLRGRVGRSGMRAYAYLFHPPDRTLSEEAYERLRTIGEHTELGSGFKIAMRDLEIRGAGNLLGQDQSGHIAAVGYDLYVRMVNEAMAQKRGEPLRGPAEIKLELPLDAHLPPEYVEREDLRLEAYRRLSSVTTPQEVDDVRAEWRDRFGPPPPPAETLLEVARLRAECARVGVQEVTVTRPGAMGKAVARISPLRLAASAKVRLQRLHKDAIYKEDLSQLIVPVPRSAPAAKWATALLEELLPAS